MVAFGQDGVLCNGKNDRHPEGAYYLADTARALLLNPRIKRHPSRVSPNALERLSGCLLLLELFFAQTLDPLCHVRHKLFVIISGYGPLVRMENAPT
jgi:hypothetical protein